MLPDRIYTTSGFDGSGVWSKARLGSDDTEYIRRDKSAEMLSAEDIHNEIRRRCGDYMPELYFKSSAGDMLPFIPGDLTGDDSNET